MNKDLELALLLEECFEDKAACGRSTPGPRVSEEQMDAFYARFGPPANASYGAISPQGREVRIPLAADQRTIDAIMTDADAGITRYQK
tara:strand:+ start:117 stop:380 length:264 start_codon:yes stop_codon:yes gene_type:complete